MKRLIMSVMAAGMLLTASAAKTAQVTINGMTLEKTPVALSFNGDKVIVHFGDSDSTEAPLEAVTVAFTEAGSTVVSQLAGADVFRFNGVTGDVLTVSGLPAQTAVSIIDLSGKTVYSTVADGTLEINISEFPAATYLLRAGKEVVKFVKH